MKINQDDGKVFKNRINDQFYEIYRKLDAGGFLRLKEVLILIPVSRSTWWNYVKMGRFPQGIKLTPRTTAWRTSDIKKLLDEIM